MNRTLIGALDAINGLLALLIIVAGLVIGLFAGPDVAAKPVTGVIGALLGLVVASIVCGLLAVFIEIEQHLRRIVALREMEVRSNTSS